MFKKGTFLYNFGISNVLGFFFPNKCLNLFGANINNLRSRAMKWIKNVKSFGKIKD